MKKHLLARLLLGAIVAISTACSDPNVPLPPETEEPGTEETEDPDALHDKIRNKPYPKADNELFINPAPLIVPQAMKAKDARLQFELSAKEDFTGETTVQSPIVPWNMFNPHKVLNTGTWYWRFRSVPTSGAAQAWSETYAFEVKAETPTFVTPAVDKLMGQLPIAHPRLYCFLDAKMEQARRQIKTHREYKNLIGRAAIALRADYSTLPNPHDKATEIRQNTDYLYQAYHLMQDPVYTNKALEFLRLLIAAPLTDKQLFASNFGSTDIASCYLFTYDIAYDRLTSAERTACETVLMRVARFYYQMYCGAQENHIFDNHFWQHNLRVLFQCAFVLHDKAAYTAEARQMIEYYYELWTARAPDSGFNRDGVWRNGVGYFTANTQTLFYMPSLFSHLTRANFLLHPWYQNAGKAMMYSWLPNSQNTGFGDGNENSTTPDRQRIAFADFLAREVGDSYSGWYATQCATTLADDFDMRLYRMASDGAYGSATLPPGAAKYIWHRDAGEVVMHSDMEHSARNLALSFRSSTFGSGSHTLADQNSFQLVYRGANVYRSSGYYLHFSDAHNLASYRHTRAHNSILINGIGQPFSMQGYGNVVRALGGDHITYCLGDASHAYSGISDDKMWMEHFATAGITQTPADGFGKTPLTLYRRHVLMLHPDIVLLYDELEASEPVRWDWLLHSAVPFEIDNNQKQFTTIHAEQGFTAVAQQFSRQSSTVTQTDRFVVPPDPKLFKPGRTYPNQWHLTAAFGTSAKNRILTLIQLVPDGEKARPITSSAANSYQCGEWTIQVGLEPTQPTLLKVTSNAANATLEYQSGQATQLNDRIEGKQQTVKMTDYVPISTRRGGY